MSIHAEELPLARIQHWARTRPEAVYLTQPLGGDALRNWTWAQAADEARRVAAWLRAQGASRGWPERARVGILSKNCAHWILMDFAIWMAGYVSVPLYPSASAATVRQILEHSEAVACFVGKLDDWKAIAPGLPASILLLACALSPAECGIEPRWERIVADTRPLEPIAAREAGELATIIYTSGTTGVPKGVMHAFGTFALAPKNTAEIWPVGAQERVLSHLPLAHVAERLLVEANSVYHGFHVFFAESLDTFVRDLRRARPTFFGTVPRLWTKFQQGIYAQMPKARLDRLLALPWIGRLVGRRVLAALGLDRVRYAACGAAPMPTELLSWFRKLGLDLFEVYGMTENFALSHGTRPGEMRIGYVGRPYPGVECRIGAGGEVLVKSPANMLGYYKAPELTREALDAEGWLHTGDVGEIDELGRLRITGRLKEIFKTAKGKYVAPAPIEDRLSRHPQLEAVCVCGAGLPQPFAIAMPAPCALQALADGSARQAMSEALAEHLERVNAQLEAHEKLAFLAVVREPWTVDNGLITPTLKVKRANLEARYAPKVPAWAARRQAVVFDD
jgi:long-chain acyl-CoA synthetase